MTWSKRPVHWEDDTAHCYSIVFSWDLYEWAKDIQPELDGKDVVVGGPAVKMMPELVPDWVTIGQDMPALWRHNPEATRTSLGCIRRCPFCAVPKMEGNLVELDEWEVKPIVIDNNLLACSTTHFDKVIDSMLQLEWCDFNQGLDARLLTDYHAQRFTELREPTIRLAFDSTKYESSFIEAVERLKKAGLPNRCIKVYVLMGFDDTPEDALYRLGYIWSMGIKPNPMRYQPINTIKKNDYVHPAWTHRELDRYMSYWSNLRYTASVPFDEYVHHKRN